LPCSAMSRSRSRRERSSQSSDPRAAERPLSSDCSQVLIHRRAERLTALENVQVPLELRGTPGATERARELIDRVGLTGRGHHFPTQLSGGEQQRVAIARAFANSPKILFADEPTGNLDNATGHRIFELLQSLNTDGGSTIVLVTHELTLAARASRMIRLLDGAIVEDTGATREVPA